MATYVRMPTKKLSWFGAAQRFIYNKDAEHKNFMQVFASVAAGLRMLWMGGAAVTVVDGPPVTPDELVWISFAVYAVFRITMIKRSYNRPVRVSRQ